MVGHGDTHGVGLGIYMVFVALFFVPAEIF